MNIALMIRIHAHKAKEQNVLKVNNRMDSGTIMLTTVMRAPVVHLNNIILSTIMGQIL